MTDKPPGKPGFKPWKGTPKRSLSEPVEDPFAQMRALADEVLNKPQPALRLKEAVVMDPSGFSQPVPALRLMIPADWEGQGQVEWVPSYDVPANAAQLSFYARDSSGRFSFNIYPNFTWVHSIGPMGATGMPPLNAPGFIEQRLLPQVRAHVQDAGVHERTFMQEVAEATRRAALEQLRGIQGMGMDMELQVDSARVRVQYGYEGVTYEELFFCTIQNMISSMPMPMMGFGGPSGMRTFVLTAERIYSFRAPAGQLSEGLMNTIIASIRPDARWQAAVSQAVRNMNQIKSKGAADRAQINRQAMEDISRMQRETWQRQQESNDRMHHKFVQNLRGVESWVDTGSGRVVELEVGFKSAWRNGLGEVVTSQDPNFDANRVFQGSWSRLRRKD